MTLESNNRELVLPLFDTVLFPGVKTKITVGKTLRGILEELGMTGSFTMAALTVREKDEQGRLSRHSFYKVGTRIRIESSEPTDKGGLLLNIDTLRTIDILNIELLDNQFWADYQIRGLKNDLSSAGEREILRYVKTIITETGEHIAGSEEFVKPLIAMENLNGIIANVIPYIQTDLQQKQELLEAESPRERAMTFVDMLLKQKEAFSIQMELAQKFQEKTNSHYRKNMLREQMKAIREELNEGNTSEEDSYEDKILSAEMPEEAEQAALKELQKMESMDSSSPEYGKVRDYLDLLTALPWKKAQVGEIDLARARDILNEQHFGLEKVKERIIQHLAVMKLKKEKQGSILLLVGPPGTGKTSLGKSIAQALDRPYERLSLGGVRDEAELRGHRRTYVGALPGRIIQAMKKAGQRNPVFVLDEVDKISSSHGGGSLLRPA